ncbi:D-2-hydroxyacid dehydrogenase [Reichenbachiella versicolor]|uniref:D-2-hydroxyacid dehydrogenase n=1 Tax=Reichenbachiella versicolor TaxID=1821036 RepID=UPI000D6E74A0|nr:D-2-hydroxyacid dehydrogenase [Reichenbachiella versicolor]
MNKIVFLDASTVNLDGDVDFYNLEAIGDLEDYPNTKSEEEIIRRAEKADAIVVNKTVISRSIFEALPQLKHISIVATGYNNIDLEAATDHNVTVSNVQGYAKDCVPQYVFAMMLNFAVKLNNYNRDVKNGDWQKSGFFALLRYPTFELAGKTIGVVGYGAIGKGVVRIAKAFGMKVLVNTASGQSDDETDIVSIDQVYDKSDFVVLCCPLNESNYHMIDNRVLHKMKSNAYLINAGRGGLVNAKDLADALNNGVIAGAGVDVLETEPPTKDPLLEDVKNLVITPHTAWATVESRQRLIDEVALNIADCLNGGKRNVVN